MEAVTPQTVWVWCGCVPVASMCKSSNDLHPNTTERPEGTAEITIDPDKNYERARKTTGTGQEKTIRTTDDPLSLNNLNNRKNLPKINRGFRSFL